MEIREKVAVVTGAGIGSGTGPCETRRGGGGVCQSAAIPPALREFGLPSEYQISPT